jgi:hypothetical protein
MRAPVLGQNFASLPDLSSRLPQEELDLADRTVVNALAPLSPNNGILSILVWTMSSGTEREMVANLTHHWQPFS